MDWVNYREKLGIAFSDEKKVQYFMVKMFNALNVVLADNHSGCITAREYVNFCDMVGCEINQEILAEYCSNERFEAVLGVLRRYKKNLPEFIAYYIALVNVTDESRYGNWKRREFVGLLKRMLADSKIHFDIIEDSDGCFLFPKGATEMDAALVSEPLYWLGEYPKSHVAYIKALREYSNSTSENASDVADKFRKTLETFFQEFFATDKALENCKALYGDYLKENNVPKEIANNLETLLQCYANFMNNYAKHHDKTGINVLEYIMYQTGNIIRLMITLKKSN